MLSPPRRRGLLSAVVLLWVLFVAHGFERLWRFSATPGPEPTNASDWPSRTLVRDLSRPTLVMFLHPECSCSEASLQELSRLVAKVGTRVSVIVLIGDSELGLHSPARNTLWRTALAIPDVTTRIDEDGQEAAVFGARTSGQAFLYDALGQLAFSGGITSGRGQVGDNDGESALLALITQGDSPLARTPVFGCLLKGRSQS